MITMLAILYWKVNGTATLIYRCSSLFVENTDLKIMPFALCSKISNFFLKMNFLDRLKIENPSCERDTFIFRVFYDPGNSGNDFSEKCMSCS